MKFLSGLFLCLSASTVWAQQYTISTIAGGAPAPVEAAAASLALAPAGRVTTDPSGNLYFTALNSVFRVDPSGNAIRVAGTGRAGFAGDGGPALSAELNGPQGMYIDSAGDVYIADTGNNRVRLVQNGVITTIAGNGQAGSMGDYGDPLQAQLHLPMAVAVDQMGDVFICDTGNNTIREVSQGVITPYSGDYVAGLIGDGGGPNSAAYNTPTDIVFDAAGDMFIADSGNARIREISGGIVNSVVGSISGSPTSFTEGGSAVGTLLTTLRSVAVDSAGDTIYLTDSDANRIRKVFKGVITTVVGTGPAGFTGDGGAATSAQMNYPSSVTVDPSGDLYFVDYNNGRIRQVNTSGNISTLAGNGTGHYSGDGGSAQSAQMNGPLGLAFANGQLYIADTNNQRVRAVNSNGIISSVAGTGAPGFGGDSGPAASSELWYPNGVAADAHGNLFIADTANQRVRKVSSSGTITTFAGTGTGGYSGDNGPAANAALNTPVAALEGPDGSVYIADYNNHAIRRVSAAGTITTLVGNGTPGYTGDGGPAGQAQLNSPAGLALDPAGNLYIADSGNHVVRVIGLTGKISTFAGTGMLGDTGDGGLATAAELISPAGVAVDGLGDVLIVDGGSGKVRLVNPVGQISTIAGNGGVGYTGDNGPATAAEFNGVSAIAIDPAGNVYLADRANFAIRMLQVTSSSLSSGAVTNGASNRLGAIAPGEFITLYATGIGPQTVTSAIPDSNGVYPAQVGGAKVYINGVPAPLVYSWTNQIGAQVPYEVTPGHATLSVEYAGQMTLQLPLQVGTAAPALFTADGSGAGEAWALNADGTMNSIATPAQQGTVIVLVANGIGLMSPDLQDGINGASEPIATPNIMIEGRTARVQAAHGAFGLIPGLVVLYVQVPNGVSGSAVPVSISSGSDSSSATVTIAVQ